MKNRLRPPFWTHDAYPLRQLAKQLTPTVASCFGSHAGETVVDFGCGDSPYQALFERHAIRYLDCDLPGSNASVIFEPDQPLPIETGSTAGVVSFQVLEHVWNLQWYLSEAHRILKENGRLVLSTHGVWPYHPHPGDFRRWTRTGLIKEIEAHGFTLEEPIAIVGPLAWTVLFQCMALGAMMRKIPLLGSALAGALATLSYPCLALADRITPAEWSKNNSAIYLVVATKKKHDDSV